MVANHAEERAKKRGLKALCIGFVLLFILAAVYFTIRVEKQPEGSVQVVSEESRFLFSGMHEGTIWQLGKVKYIQITCLITLQNMFESDKTVTLSAVMPEMVTAGLLKQERLHSMLNTGLLREYTIAAKTKQVFTVSFIGEYGGKGNAYQGNLPLIEVQVLPQGYEQPKPTKKPHPDRYVQVEKKPFYSIDQVEKWYVSEDEDLSDYYVEAYHYKLFNDEGLLIKEETFRMLMLP